MWTKLRRVVVDTVFFTRRLVHASSFTSGNSQQLTSGQRRRRRLDGANDLCSQNRWWTSFTLLRIILSSIKARSTAPLTGNVTEHNVVLTTHQVEWRKNKQRWTECGRRRFHCAVDRARRLNNFREQWIFGHFKASVLPWIRKLSSGALIRTHNWLIIS